MASIYAFPGPGVWAEIHDAIRLHAAGKLSRQRMMSFVAGRLSEYGLRRLNVNNYEVRVAEPVHTIFGIWPVVIIEARQVSENPSCLACGEIGCRYLGGDDIMTVMCLDCGCIYKYRPGEAGAGEEGRVK